MHPLHGNPYSSCWHQLMGISIARWLSSSMWDFLLFCLLHTIPIIIFYSTHSAISMAHAHVLREGWKSLRLFKYETIAWLVIGGIEVGNIFVWPLQKKYTSVMIRVCHSRSLFCHACTSMTNLWQNQDSHTCAVVEVFHDITKIFITEVSTSMTINRASQKCFRQGWPTRGIHRNGTPLSYRVGFWIW